MSFSLVCPFTVKQQAENNSTEEGDQLFKTGIKILQQSKSQKQKAE